MPKWIRDKEFYLNKKIREDVAYMMNSFKNIPGNYPCYFVGLAFCEQGNVRNDNCINYLHKYLEEFKERGIKTIKLICYLDSKEYKIVDRVLKSNYEGDFDVYHFKATNKLKAVEYTLYYE